jgi:hypothetical protein
MALVAAAVARLSVEGGMVTGSASEAMTQSRVIWESARKPSLSGD